MSYKKVQQLANKFIKTSSVEYYTFPSQKEKDQFSVQFLRNIRVSLNELEGDILTLRYKDFPRKELKELGLFWRHCIEIYKGFNERQPEEGVKEFSDLLLDKKDWITNMMSDIQKHLDANEIDFLPHPGLSQARANGLQELIKAVDEAAQKLKNLPVTPPTPAQSETIRPGDKIVDEQSFTKKVV